MKNETTGDKLLLEVSALIRARNPIIIIISPEEARVEAAVAAAAGSQEYDIRLWDHAQGVTNLLGELTDYAGKKIGSVAQSTRMPPEILRAIKDSRERAVWVLRDFHPFWKSPEVNRALRNLARELPTSKRNEARTVVIVTPSADVPVEFADHVVVVRWKLPDREEMAGVYDQFIGGLPETLGKPPHTRPHPAKSTPPEIREAAIDAAMGLSVVQAQGIFAKSVVTKNGYVDVQTIADGKKAIINASNGIEYFDPDPRGLEAVGGLDVLKRWLVQRRHAFSEKAKAFGIEKPKGVLIAGVPGTGKSLTAKAIASAWAVPLLRLDMGAAKGGIVGESERKIRACFAVADALGPCVVWLDEIEKALAGAVGGSLDSGVSSDALGALLTWMEDRKGSAFVIATANDVSKLPPEILRKGRFDEIFFVDLPGRDERRAILRVALTKAGREDVSVDFDLLAELTAGFTGSEIVSIVPDALFQAFEEGERVLTTEDLIASAKTVVPLSKTAAEKIQGLRAWAQSRARPASLPETMTDVSATARALDVEFEPV